MGGPRPSTVPRLARGHAEAGVEPAERLIGGLRAEQDADMLDTRAECGAPGGAEVHVPIGDTRARRLRSARQADHPQRLRLEPPLPLAGDDEEVARARGRGGPREHRDGDRGADVRRLLRGADHDVGPHGVPEQGEPAVAQGAGERENADRLVHERPGRPALAGDAAREGLRMAAVAGKVEGDGDEAVAGEGGREGGHERLRAGKAVRHDDDGRGTASLGAVDRCGRGADDGPLDRKAGLRVNQHGKAEPDRACCNDGDRCKGVVAGRLPHGPCIRAAREVRAASGSLQHGRSRTLREAALAQGEQVNISPLLG